MRSQANWRRWPSAGSAAPWMIPVPAMPRPLRRACGRSVPLTCSRPNPRSKRWLWPAIRRCAAAGSSCVVRSAWSGPPSAGLAYTEKDCGTRVFMERKLQERMVGAGVLILALVIVGPMILDGGSGDDVAQDAVPGQRSDELRTHTFSLSQPSPAGPTARDSESMAVPAAADGDSNSRSGTAQQHVALAPAARTDLRRPTLGLPVPTLPPRRRPSMRQRLLSRCAIP